MTRLSRLICIVAVSVAAGAVTETVPRRQSTATTIPAASESRVDQVFARWKQDTPGCAVGVGVGGASVLQKAYGMADLEHDVRNTPDTIFEAGSVAKQFTAASVLLLAKEGKLSLDDPVRKYIPELPDYGPALLIRHMLNHTSGLRDWGEVAAIAGWPRTTRVHTHAHVLDIVSRQRSLNFTPGSQYSYSNTGYNLAAIIVSRVSGRPFAEFSQERLFKPLGMTHTSWRDDFTRIVRNRAIAYAEGGAGEFRMDMPFENVHGNGGLLTTVGDLLKWNKNFVSPKIGDAAFVREQQGTGRFNDGRPQAYALGLFIGQYRGLREVSHSGATAGYRAYLVRYPDRHVSVAVLCNVSSATATQYAQAVTDMYLGSALRAAQSPAAPRARPDSTFHPTPTDLATFAGSYSSDEAETTFVAAMDGETLVLKQRPDTVLRLRPTTMDTFAAQPLGIVKFLRDAAGRVNEMSVSRDRVFDMRFTRTP